MQTTICLVRDEAEKGVRIAPSKTVVSMIKRNLGDAIYATVRKRCQGGMALS
jgi:hypothetical protein